MRYLDLKDFDFFCQTDVEILDINGPGSGNVRSLFVPYTTSFNREMVKCTYDIYASHGHSTSEAEIERIVTFPDTTNCADGDNHAVDGSVADGGNGPNDEGLAVDAATSGVVDAGSSRQPSGGGSSGCSCTIGRTGRGSTGLIVFLLCLGMAV